MVDVEHQHDDLMPRRHHALSQGEHFRPVQRAGQPVRRRHAPQCRFQLAALGDLVLQQHARRLGLLRAGCRGFREGGQMLTLAFQHLAVEPHFDPHARNGFQSFFPEFTGDVGVGQDPAAVGGNQTAKQHMPIVRQPHHGGSDRAGAHRRFPLIDEGRHVGHVATNRANRHGAVHDLPIRRGGSQSRRFQVPDFTEAAIEEARPHVPVQHQDTEIHQVSRFGQRTEYRLDRFRGGVMRHPPALCPDRRSRSQATGGSARTMPDKS